jgi:hypothetical protein
MKRSKKVSAGFRGLLFSGAVVLGVAGVLLGNGPVGTSSTQKANRYIGASKCKNCHSSEETGDQHGKWQEMAHAKAFETLASADAKAAAKAAGIDDPQKAEACVKCHVTAYGVDEKQIKKGFKVEMGVQCETCHGPGEAHMKARMMAAASGEENPKLDEGEIINTPAVAACIECHNEESPTYKPFCFCDRMNKILHWNPKKHTAEEMEKGYVCECADACDCENAKCADGCEICRGKK